MAGYKLVNKIIENIFVETQKQIPEWSPIGKNALSACDIFSMY